MRRRHEPRGIIHHMKGKTQFQPNFRGFRALRTVQGLDYVSCLRGMDRVEVWDFDRWLTTKEKKRPVRDFSFIMDVNNAVRRPKEARDRSRSQLRHLFPLINSFVPSGEDWALVIEALESHRAEKEGEDDVPLSPSSSPAPANPWPAQGSQSRSSESAPILIDSDSSSESSSSDTDSDSESESESASGSNSGSDAGTDSGSSSGSGSDSNSISDSGSGSGSGSASGSDSESSSDSDPGGYSAPAEEGMDVDTDNESLSMGTSQSNMIPRLENLHLQNAGSRSDSESRHSAMEIDSEDSDDESTIVPDDRSVTGRQVVDLTDDERQPNGGYIDRNGDGRQDSPLFVFDDGYIPSYPSSSTGHGSDNRNTGNDWEDASNNSISAATRALREESSLFVPGSLGTPSLAPTRTRSRSSATISIGVREDRRVTIDLTGTDDMVDDFLPEGLISPSDASRKRNYVKVEPEEGDASESKRFRTASPEQVPQT